MSYDFVKNRAAVREMRADTCQFLVSSKQWRTYSAPVQLHWQKCVFDRSNQKTIPDEPGIYAFVVEYANAGLPPHGFIMYFGIAGLKAGRTLKKRFGEYIREKSKGKRLSVQMMLNEYEQDLYFHFVPVNLPPADLATLETSLIDAIMPPINIGDLSAEMARRKRAM